MFSFLLTLRLPGCYHPHAQNLSTELVGDAGPHIPSNLTGDTDDDAPRYVGKVHQYPANSTRSGLVHHAEGAGALLDFGAFEGPTQVFEPTSATQDP